MNIIRGSKHFKHPAKPIVLTMGNFDGVHLGHQAILKKLAAAARHARGIAVIYTFDPHPVKAIAPKASPKLLQTERQKLASLKKCGIDTVIIEPFTVKFARISPKRFFQDIIIKRLKPEQMIVGYDLTFGKHRLGDTKSLEEMCVGAGIELEIVHPVFLGENLLSSTQVRSLVARGDMETATKMLSRPFALEGRVVRGLGIGKVLGFHTANIEPENELLPPDGVYITRTLGHVSVTNIGKNPTFGGRKLSIETHILNFSKSVYGKRIEVEFFKRLRGEMTFGNPLDLKRQIGCDINAAKRFFHGR